MTSIFAYPLANAWVIVGDKLETDCCETLRAKQGYEVFPLKLASKIEQQGNWIFGFSGNVNEIEKIKRIFDTYIDVKRHFKQIILEIKNNYESLSDSTISIILFDILENSCYKINICDLYSNNLQNYCVTSIESAFIGSGENKWRGTFLLSSLLEFQSKKLKNLSDIIKSSVSVLNNIALLDYPYTGSPYIFGCDIFIIKNKKVKKYQIIPNGYKFREENKDWKIINRD